MYVESCMILVVCGSFIETRRGTRQTIGYARVLLNCILPGYARVAQRAVPSAPAQVAVGSTAFVVTPHRALAHMLGPPHEGLKGCESVETLLPPAAILERPP